MGYSNKRITPLRYMAGFTLVLFMATGLLMAQQETGRIVGTVTDPSRAVIPNASVTARSLATSAERRVTTGRDGSYVLPSLLPGNYAVTVQMSGFATARQQVTVPVGGIVMADFSLAVGVTSTTVEVTGESTLLVNTETQTLQSVVTTKQILELPTLTRNPYDLVAISGNVNQVDPRDASSASRGAGYNINGQRSASTNILLDGSDNNDTFTATVGQQVPLDSVQEFSIVSSTFTAEYGRAGGGVVNVATKSGSNGLHGTLYEFNRVSALASNPYDYNANGNKKGVFARNQFGFSIGGPAIKDKLFFFNNTEWFRIRSSSTSTALVPTPQLIAAAAQPTQAFFAAYGTLKTQPNGRIYTKDDIPNLCNATGPCANLAGTTPVWATINYPVPANAGGGDPRNEYQTVTRIDYNLSQNTTIYGRYALQSQDYFKGTNAESPYKGFDTGTNTFNNNFLLSVMHSFSPHLVSQTKVVFNRLNQVQPFGDNPSSPTLYLASRNTTSSILGISVALPGYLPYNPGVAIPFGGPQNLGQVYEDLTWITGGHTFRFGGQYIYLRDNRAFGAYQNAVEQLGSNLRQGMDNFLLGQLSTFNAAVDPQGKFPGDTLTLPVGTPDFTRSNRYHDFALYVQDSWRVAPRLTINMGLRWEYFGVQHNKWPEKDSNFYLGSGDFLDEQVRNGRVLLAQNSPYKGLWAKDMDNLAPRIGFAWDLIGDGKTSIRGGYGISYERNFGNVTYNVIQNPPNYAVIVLGAADVGGNLPVYLNNSGPLGGSTGSKVLPPTSLRAVNEKIKTAYAHFWSAAFEHEFMKNTAFSIQYSGSKGVGLYSIDRVNVPGSGAVYFGDTGSALSTYSNPQYSVINYRTGDGFSNYNAMIAEIRTNDLLSRGLNLVFNYTLSHSNDNNSDTFNGFSNNYNLGLLDPYNPQLDKGDSDFDIRNRISLSAVWNVPFAKNTTGPVKAILDGWSLTPLFSAQTGNPFTVFDCTNAYYYCSRMILVNSDQAYTGPSNPAPIPGVPNSFKFIDLRNQASGIGSFYNPITETNDFGPFPENMTGRNTFRQPGRWDFSVGIYKNFQLPKEGYQLQFRSEFYNILNHSNLYADVYYADISGDDYINAYRGAKGTSAERRNIQFALKFIF